MWIERWSANGRERRERQVREMRDAYDKPMIDKTGALHDADGHMCIRVRENTEIAYRGYAADTHTMLAHERCPMDITDTLYR